MAHRTRDIGVRMAVGAGTRDILLLIAKQGGPPVTGGLIFGLALTFTLTGYLSSFLYGVAPTDPITFCAVVFVILTAASLSMILPARRAAGLDPMLALRDE